MTAEPQNRHTGLVKVTVIDNGRVKYRETTHVPPTHELTELRLPLSIRRHDLEIVVEFDPPARLEGQEAQS
jgi:hypothetical protein